MLGFDNEALGANLLPPRTTMEMPHADTGRHAVKDLHRLVLLPAPRPRHPRMRLDCPLTRAAR